jgi:archaellum component FlaC
MTELLANNAIVLIVIFGLLLVVFFAVLAQLILTIRARQHVYTPDEVQALLGQAEERARAIVAEATAHARDTRLSIEKDRMKALNEDKQEVKLLLDAYRAKLERVVKELSYGVEREHMRATSAFVERLQSIESRVAGNAEEAKQSMNAFTNQSSSLFERLATEIQNVEKGIQHLAVALEEAASNEADKNAEIVRREMQKIGSETAASIVTVARELDGVLRQSVEGEFARITNDLAQYRTARMRLVDERILSLIEETAQIALQKKLSMQDQSDLVYRSLEEAKERGIFI